MTDRVAQDAAPMGHGAARLRLLREGSATHRIETRVLPRATCGPDDPGAPAYRLFRALPRQVAPAGGYPMLTMLDGNAAFDYLTADLLAAVPGLAIAAIGHDTEGQFARPQRNLDYTPPHAPGQLRADPHVSDRLAGGADAFLDRLTGPLRAEAEAGLAVDPARRSLWGHSLGGLATLYCALTRPGAFARHATISPSIWWDAALIGRIAAEARFDPAAPVRIWLALGDREQRTGSGGPPPTGPAPATMALAGALTGRPGLSLTVEVLEGCVHIATLPASLPGALALAAG